MLYFKRRCHTALKWTGLLQNIDIKINFNESRHLQNLVLLSNSWKQHWMVTTQPPPLLCMCGCAMTLHIQMGQNLDHNGFCHLQTTVSKINLSDKNLTDVKSIFWTVLSAGKNSCIYLHHFYVNVWYWKNVTGLHCWQPVGSAAIFNSVFLYIPL